MSNKIALVSLDFAGNRPMSLLEIFCYQCPCLPGGRFGFSHGHPRGRFDLNAHITPLSWKFHVRIVRLPGDDQPASQCAIVKSSVDQIEYFFEFHNLSLWADGKKLAKLCKGLIIFGLETMAIPRSYSHFLFGLIQSGFTTAIAAAIASAPLIHNGLFVTHWFSSWMLACAIMIPFVLLATPLLQSR